MVVEELRNERVDVIQWDEDPAKYVAQALSPARVNRVIIDEDKNYATVIVPDDQLSLAIGKEGQNARLAARLTGWHIDIKSASFNASAPVHEKNLLLERKRTLKKANSAHMSLKTAPLAATMHVLGSRFCGVHADCE